MRYTGIRGLTDNPARRRLPRLGKIRLGERVKIKGKSCNCEDGCQKCTRPTDLPHFVIPPKVAEKHGEKPTELPILLPSEDPAENFPCAYKLYGGAGLKCTGDGERAHFVSEGTGELQERECPCDELKDGGHCSAVGTLNVILPSVGMGGVYQVITGSVTAILDILSAMDWVRDMCGGRLALIPLILKRVEREMTYRDSAGKQRKSRHWPMTLELPANLNQLNSIRQAPERILGTVADADLPAPALPAPSQEEALEKVGATDLEPEPPQPPAEKPDEPEDDSKEARADAKKLTLALAKKAGWTEEHIAEKFAADPDFMTLDDISVKDWRLLYSEINADYLRLQGKPKKEGGENVPEQRRR